MPRNVAVCRPESGENNQFLTLVEAQTIIEAWRRDYNDERPHSSLDGLTPRKFADRHTAMLKELALKKHQSILA